MKPAPHRDALVEHLRSFLADHHGVISAREAARIGITANGLRALVRDGILLHIARGTYVDAELHGAGDATKQHRLTIRALLRGQPRSMAASHQSGAVVHGLPVLSKHLGRVHLTRQGDSPHGRRHDAFTVHRRPAGCEFTQVDGMPVVKAHLAVIGTALELGARSGVMAADQALRRGLTTKAELEKQIEGMRHTPGLSAVRHAVAHACPSAESAGESLSRVVLTELGFVVVPQHWIDEDGMAFARVDFYLPDLHVVVEFDGAVKYDGVEGSEALVREKQREDRIRRLGYGVVRLTWADLFRPEKVRALVLRAAATARRAA